MGLTRSDARTLEGAQFTGILRCSETRVELMSAWQAWCRDKGRPDVRVIRGRGSNPASYTAGMNLEFLVRNESEIEDWRVVLLHDIVYGNLRKNSTGCSGTISEIDRLPDWQAFNVARSMSDAWMRRDPPEPFVPDGSALRYVNPFGYSARIALEGLRSRGATLLREYSADHGGDALKVYSDAGVLDAHDWRNLYVYCSRILRIVHPYRLSFSGTSMMFGQVSLIFP